MTRFMMTLTASILTASTTLAAGLPGMRGVDHIGLTVHDMTEAETFFADVLGCEKDGGTVLWSSRAPSK